MNYKRKIRFLIDVTTDNNVSIKVFYRMIYKDREIEIEKNIASLNYLHASNSDWLVGCWLVGWLVGLFYDI